MHALRFPHALGATNPLAELIFNRTLRPGGGQETVAQVAYNPIDPYHAIWAPSWRMVADPNDPDRSRWQAFTGESGHAGSRHYDDLQPRWANGEMQAMAGEGPWDTLVLRPEGVADRLMPSRRDQIKLTEEELAELLESERVVVVSTIGPRGWPHVMPLWYVPRDGDVWIWTYAKSQKVKNLERDPRATLMIETGVEYTELRGVQIEAEAELIRDVDRIVDFAKDLTVRYSEGIDSVEGDAAAALQAQAPKRVAIDFHPKRIATWDPGSWAGPTEI